MPRSRRGMVGFAGCPARLVTSTGAVMGRQATAKTAFFFNTALQAAGYIVFSWTDNAQFDYSADFDKVLASAKLAE